jgi:hypothetical protein
MLNMKKIISTAIKSVATLALLQGADLDAANLRHNRILIQESIHHVRDFHRRGRTEFNQAERKLTQVRHDIFDLRPSQDKFMLERSLDEALRALRDYRMPDFSVARIVEDRGHESISIIDRLIRLDEPQRGHPALERAIVSLNRASDDTRMGRIGSAQMALRDALSNVRSFRHDRDLDNAAFHIQQAEQALHDRFLPVYRQIEIVDQNVRNAIRLIQQSREYLDRRPAPPSYDYLGETRSFSDRYVSTETVFVGRNEGRFDNIALTARQSDLRIDRVEVTFGNGRIQVFYGRFLRMHERLILDLRGNNDRIIRSIRITAQSSGGPRSPLGSVVVTGL